MDYPKYIIKAVENNLDQYRVLNYYNMDQEIIGTHQECTDWIDEHEIVTVVSGSPVNRKTLKLAFELVENKLNWKLPIDKWVLTGSEPQIELISKAVEFFVGKAPDVEKIGKYYHFRSPGYYVITGA